MRLIVSAYRAEVNPWRNAQQTALLLQTLSKMQLLAQLVVGTFAGKREIAVEVTGFVSHEYMGQVGALLRRRFEQTSVFAEYKGNAYLLTQYGTEMIGTVVHGVQMIPGNDGTEYLDGRRCS